MTDEEIKETLVMVRSRLLSDLDSCIETWRDSYDGSDDPEDHFDHLQMALRQYEEAFEDDEQATGWITAGRAKIEKVIEELRANPPEVSDSDDYAAHQPGPHGDDGLRSILMMLINERSRPAGALASSIRCYVPSTENNW